MAALEQAMTDQTRQVALVAAKPQVKHDLAAFIQALASANTPAQLLASHAALNVLLNANGLGDQVANTVLAMQALLPDPSRCNALVNPLADLRWLGANTVCSFAAKGLSVLNDPKTIAEIATGCAEALWRTNLRQTTPGLSNALDFQARAATITNVAQILGDLTCRTVLTTALGIPERIAFQTLAAQERAISIRIDLTKFHDAAFVTQVIQRYPTAPHRPPARRRVRPRPALRPRRALRPGTT